MTQPPDDEHPGSEADPSRAPNPAPGSSGDDAASQEAADAQRRAKGRRRRRRNRRLCWWALSIVVTVLIAGYYARAPLAEIIVARSLPSILSSELGRPVTIGDARLRETGGRELVLELLDVRIGSPGDAEFNGILRSVTVRMNGWLDLGSGIDVVERISVHGGKLTIPPSEERAPTKPFPSVVIPTSLPRLPFPIDVTRVHVDTGDFRARVDAELEDGRVEVDLDGIEGVSIGDESPLRSASVTTRWTDTSFEGIELELLEWGISVSGTLTRAPLGSGASRPYTGELAIDVAGGRGVYGVTLPTVAGEGASAVGSVRFEQPTRTAELFGLTTKLGGPVVFSSTLNMSEDDLSFRGDLRVHGSTLDVIGSVTASDVDIQVTGEAIAVGPILEWYDIPGSPSANVSGTVTLAGPRSAPIMTATLDMPRGEVTITEERLVVHEVAAAATWILGQPIRIDSVTMKLFDGNVSIAGTLAADDLGECDATLSFNGWDLAQLKPWFSYARDLAGRATGTMTVRGPWDQLDYRVNAKVSQGTMAFVGYTERFRDVSFVANLDREGLKLEELVAKLGGGTVRGSANLTLGQREGLNVSGVESVTLGLDLERVRLVRTRDFWVRGSGDATLTIPFGNQAPAPTLTAQLTVDRGVYDRNYYPRLSEGNSLPFDLFTVESEPFASMSLDVRGRFAGGFLIRNNYLEVAPHGELRLGGTGRQPILTGRLTATNGRVKLPHLIMEIERAEIRFPDYDPFNPDLEFAGRGRLAGYDIDTVAAGKVESLAVSFSSSPQLENEDLLLLVATGQQRSELSEGGLERVAALEVARLFGPELWESIFGRSRGESLLDRVSITTEPGSDGGNERISVEIRLLDWLSAVGERDERGDTNLDLQIFRWYR